MDPIATFGTWLHTATGIKLTILYDMTDRSRMLFGILTTIEHSLVTIAASFVIGVIGTWLRESRIAWLRRIVRGYIQLFRNTPPLVQLGAQRQVLGNRQVPEQGEVLVDHLHAVGDRSHGRQAVH